VLGGRHGEAPHRSRLDPFVALTAFPPLAHAALVETYSFSNFGDWTRPDSGLVSGQITGTVDSNGFIELADLSAFSVHGFIQGSGVVDAVKANLEFFSYDTKGGQRLAWVYRSRRRQCGLQRRPFGSRSQMQPRRRQSGFDACRHPRDGVRSCLHARPDPVTLVSSVSTPEPSTWAMMLTGLAGLGLVGAHRSRMGRAPRQAGRSPA